MKIFTIVTALLVSGLTFADSQLDVRVNRIEMAVTAPDESDSEAENDAVAATSKENASSADRQVSATDYNSSRSNKADSVIEDGNTTGAKPRAAAADYNSSRSNRTGSRAHDDDSDGDTIDAKTCSNAVDDDCDDTEDAAPANHNSTRSR